MIELWNGVQSVLGAILSFFYDIIPNYGVSIICLTIVINILVFPLTLKQVRSTRAMQEIQPEMQRLRREHKDDPETMNMKVMELYRERGVSPFGCFLPLLVQMPIWFALFQVLRNPQNALPGGSDLLMAQQDGPLRFLGLDLALEPSRVVSDFGLFSLDALPYLLMVLVVIGTGFLQQRLITPNTSTQDQSPQAQSMQRVTRILPLVFGAISYIWPIGLNLYFATSNLFRTAQQLLIFRIDGRPGNIKSPKEVNRRKMLEKKKKQAEKLTKEIEELEEPNTDSNVTNNDKPSKQQGSRKKRSRRRRG